MTQRWFTLPRLAVAALGAVALLPGCMLDKQDDAEEYREAVPQREAVLVAGPETDAPVGRETASLAPSRYAQAAGPLGRRDFAKWYGFTRAVRGGVNGVTAWVLGSVGVIVHLEPSAVKDGEAVWGPYTDSLEPVTYRFRVTRVGEAEYDYVLEGRPKDSSLDADYRTVLEGHGFGKRHEQHGQGEFTIDLSAARELDPFGRAQDSGTVRVVHRLPHDLTQGALPRTIDAEVTPEPSVDRESYTVKSVANEDGTGTLRVVAQTDVDDSKATALENVTVSSRWRADGAGRADIVIAGGDIPADPGQVTAAECWGADFARSYYSDTISFEPTEGEASACVYGAP
ncbi:MAG: hypothetical protein K0R38_3452 [Polyangiaceae bacterium]|jgi:hypothetical protein|nr:hypothetical protein [Polyangiaceae bacterium]